MTRLMILLILLSAIKIFSSYLCVSLLSWVL